MTLRDSTELADSLESGNALEALKTAVGRAKHSVAGLTHHSDHGSQYSSRSYLEYLDSIGIVTSMREVGNAYDNAYAERVPSTLKRECGLDSVFKGGKDVERAVSEAVYLYNVESHINCWGMQHRQRSTWGKSKPVAL